MVDENISQGKEEEKVSELLGVGAIAAAAIVLLVPSIRDKIINLFSRTEEVARPSVLESGGVIYVPGQPEPEVTPEAGDVVVSDDGLATAAMGVAATVSLATDAAVVAKTINVAKNVVEKTQVDVSNKAQTASKKALLERQAQYNAQALAKEQAEKKAKKEAEAVAKKAAQEAADRAAKEEAERAAKEAAEKAAKSAAKVATKTAAKTALTTAVKGIPVVGWALAAADVLFRAYDPEDGTVDVGNIGESFASDFDALVNYGGMWLDDPGKAAGLTGEALVAMGEDVYDGLVDVASSKPKISAGDALVDFGQQAADAIVDVGGAIVSGASDIVSGFKSFFSWV